MQGVVGRVSRGCVGVGVAGCRLCHITSVLVIPLTSILRPGNASRSLVWGCVCVGGRQKQGSRGLEEKSRGQRDGSEDCFIQSAWGSGEGLSEEVAFE